MTIDEVIAQAEYTSQHCDKEMIEYHKEVFKLAKELKYNRKVIEVANAGLDKITEKYFNTHNDQT